MGAKAGRKGGRSYNILTCGKGWWRKYLDKKRRKAAKKTAIEEQEWYPWGDEHYDPECCSSPEGCQCGYK